MNLKVICILGAGFYQVGDQPPQGYTAKQEWALTQYRGGLRQKRCPECSKWRFPQELCCRRGNQ